MGRQTATPRVHAVPTRHASPAPHSASDLHTAVFVPHLPHELHIAVPLTSEWHALKPVRESGLHPLKVLAATAGPEKS